MFCVAVIILYGSSILLFIGVSVKSTVTEHGGSDRDVEKFLVNRYLVEKSEALDEVRDTVA